MTGKNRLAVKLAVLSTVLAAGGGGAYYYTTGGGAPWSWLTRDKATEQMQLKPADVSDSNSKLDAVASAWAATGASRRSKTAEAVPAGRSAEIAAARAEVNSERKMGQRYERYPELQTPSVPLAVVSAASDALTPSNGARTKASDQRTTSPDSVAVNDAGTEVKPAQFETTTDIQQPTAETPSIVRGQNPSDAAKSDAELVTPTGSSSDANSTASPTADALRLPEETPATGANLSAAAARARQAFSESAPAATGDRYRAAAEPARTIESGFAESGARLNPFASQPAQNPAANAATAIVPGAGSTLPPPRNMQPENTASGASGYDRLRETGRFPSTAYGNAAGGYGGQTATANGGMLGNSLGNMPPANGDILNGPEGTGRPGERALEGTQNPALVILKQAPSEIQVGKPAKFLIQIRNVGGQPAADVVIRDEVPQGTRLVSTSPMAEVNGGQLMWRFAALSVGEEKTIEMQLMPTAEGDVGSVATVTYSAQASIKTRSTMPQLAIKMTAPKQVMVGQEQRVKILLNNPGSGDATGVMLFENVPENVRHAAGPALEFEIGTLRAGETRELELVLLAQKAGKVTNVLSARAEGNLQVQQQVEFEVIAPALTVAVVGPERRYLERPATYEVRVENPGTATARDIQLITKLPKGLKFVRANNMGEYDAATHAVYWSLAELPEGEHGSVELVAMPIETGPQTLEVQGRAQQGLSDQTKQQILVEGLAAIMFEVRDLEDPIEVGRETTYEIRVVNQGTKAATNVQIGVALPEDMQFISAEGETRHSAQTNSVIFAPIKELAPKSDTVYRLKVQCRAPGDQRVTVEVKTDDLANPIRREESTRVFGDE
ncbi:MAG: hypothetical protein WD669_11415 [Pirellulales bacterium]